MPINVYYVDDEKDLCEIFSDFFTSDNIKITTFEDPKEALKVAKESPPDLLLIDFRMPGMTGEELAFALNDNTPKVLVTGDIRIDCQYPFLQIIRKPYDFNKIQSLLDTYVTP